MSSQEAPNASRLRTSWRATSRRASSAPRRSNLLIATTSAKSSMSIFSSCDAAPNSGVITYSEVSTNGTIAASPWPMPGVSTMTRSLPAALHAAIASVRPVRHLGDRASGGHRAEVDLVAVVAGCRRAVHPDPVAEQRAAAAPPGRVDREDRDAQLVLLVDAEPADQLVGERRLAGAAGAGDAQHRHGALAGGLADRVAGVARSAAPASMAVIGVREHVVPPADAARPRSAPAGRRGRGRRPRPSC